MGTLEPIALSPRDAAQFLSISKRSLSRLISSHKIVARKDGVRTLVDVASLKAHYVALPLKTDHVPFVFVHPITGSVTGCAKEATNFRRLLPHCAD